MQLGIRFQILLYILFHNHKVKRVMLKMCFKGPARLYELPSCRIDIRLAVVQFLEGDALIKDA